MFLALHSNIQCLCFNILKLRILLRIRFLSSDRFKWLFKIRGPFPSSFLFLASSFIVKNSTSAFCLASFICFHPQFPHFLINLNSSDSNMYWKQESRSCQIGIGRCHILDFHKRSHHASEFSSPREEEKELSWEVKP